MSQAKLRSHRTTIKLAMNLPGSFGDYHVGELRIGDQVVQARFRVDLFTGAVYVKGLAPPPEARPESVGALKR